MKPRVLLIGRDTAPWEALRFRLASHPSIGAVSAANDGADVPLRVARSGADIVCLDVGMPGLDAIGVTRELRDSQPRIRVIGLSEGYDPLTVLALLDAGAAGYATWKDGWDGVLRAILGVARYGKIYLCPDVASDVLAAWYSTGSPAGSAATPDARRFGLRGTGPRRLRPGGGSVRSGAGNALRAREIEHLQQWIDCSPTATFVIDRKHVVVCWNRACEQLTGVPASEMLGTRRPWRAFYRDERPVLADRALDGVPAGECREVEEFVPGMGEAGRWIHCAVAPWRDARGRVLGMIETLSDTSERKRAETALKESEERYRQLSMTDPLTGLFNSRHLAEQAKVESGRAIRYGHPLSLIGIGVNSLVPLDSGLGRVEEEHLLEKLANSMRHCLRLGDSAFRKGSREFAILLPDTDLDCARRVAERLRLSLPRLPGYPIDVGVARYEPGEDLAGWVRRAVAASESTQSVPLGE